MADETHSAPYARALSAANAVSLTDQMDALRMQIAFCKNPRLLSRLMRELDALKKQAQQAPP